MKKLIDTFPNYYVNCREKNTIKRYEQYFKLWKDWAIKFDIKVLPAHPFYVALFLLSLIQENYTMPQIESSYYGIKFFHTTLCYNDPCNHSIVKNMYQAAKRMITHKVKKKEPITIEQLTNIHETLLKNDTLANTRTVVICLLSFAGFLRFSEIINLRLSDLIFEECFLKVFIEKSKTDIYREGSWVLISKTSSKLCPVKNTLTYISLANIKKPNEFLFRALSTGKRKSKLRDKNTPLSYTRVRECFKEALKLCGINEKLYGLHSLRSGGATAAANRGVPDRLFKRHGRWRSEQAKDGYVKDNLEVLLSVSKCLGL